MAHEPCNGTGWVQEDRPDIPWSAGCGVSGLPCSCNDLFAQGAPKQWWRIRPNGEAESIYEWHAPTKQAHEADFDADMAEVKREIASA